MTWKMDWRSTLKSNISPQFNLVTEPWIPVLRREGHIQEMSILGTLQEASSAIDIIGEVPTQNFALLRLLLAILHRAIRDPNTDRSGPQDIPEWRDLSNNWNVMVRAATDYLEYFHDRFYLFHSDSPFFQVADLQSVNNDVSGLEKIMVDVPNGDPLFTLRNRRGLEHISYAEAARWLIHAHAFDPSGIRTGAVGDPRVSKGKVYPIGPGWAGKIGGVHLVGPTLKETIMLNLIAWSSVDFVCLDEDLPPWERAQLDSSEDEGGREPRGPIDVYTWQSRRIRLQADTEGVTGVVLCQGDQLYPQNRHVVEPMTAWRYSEPQSKKFKMDTYLPRLHDPSRSFWRGLEGILPFATRSRMQSQAAQLLAPTVTRWVAQLGPYQMGNGEATLRAHAVGIAYGTQNSVAIEMIDDQLEVPISLLSDQDGRLTQIAIDALAAADNAVGSLANLAGNLAEAAGIGREEKDAPVANAKADAYAALDLPFRTWLAGLSPKDNDPAKRWQRSVERVIWRLSRELLANSGPAAWVGRTVNDRHVDAGLSDLWFRKRLREALPHGMPDANEEEKMDEQV